nr:hypothetical protein [Tanacetum cinerariifolium]
MQEKLKLSKSQGASTPAEKQRMQNIPYALAVGSIMYATAVKNILKYLHNTKDMFLVYGGNMERELRVSCYTDAGYLMDANNLKSRTGHVFVLNGGAVDWKSTKQSIFATSYIDAEYVAPFDASKEAVWIRKFIYGLGIVPTIEEPISMYCDNTGAIAIAKDYGVTKGVIHFHAKVHYLLETIKLGDVKIEKIDTDDNLANSFTKALAFSKHSELTRNIGLLPASSFIITQDTRGQGHDMNNNNEQGSKNTTNKRKRDKKNKKKHKVDYDVSAADHYPDEVSKSEQLDITYPKVKADNNDKIRRTDNLIKQYEKVDEEEKQKMKKENKKNNNKKKNSSSRQEE